MFSSILRGKGGETDLWYRLYGRSVLFGTTGLYLIFKLLSNNIFFLGHMGVLSDHQLILYLLLFSLIQLANFVFRELQGVLHRRYVFEYL